MKTLSIITCVITCGFALYKIMMGADFFAYSILLFISAIAFLIIGGNWGQKENPFYDGDSIMNK